MTTSTPGDHHHEVCRCIPSSYISEQATLVVYCRELLTSRSLRAILEPRGNGLLCGRCDKRSNGPSDRLPLVRMVSVRHPTLRWKSVEDQSATSAFAVGPLPHGFQLPRGWFRRVAHIKTHKLSQHVDIVGSVNTKHRKRWFGCLYVPRYVCLS